MKRFLIPVAIFILLGVLLAYGLKLDPRKIPSPLIGKPVPTFALPSVADPKRTVRSEDLRGRAYLLNVWASWCVACREEHPFLVELKQANAIPIIGLNYKDQRTDALNWLGTLGDPYELSVSDLHGHVGIELGVYGVPETFVVDKAGVIRYKHIGPLTPEVWRTKLVPVLKEMG